MSERLIEEKWARCSPRDTDRRLDALRQRADYLQQKIDNSPVGSRHRDAREHGALMWALAELTGIGDELRREKAEQGEITRKQYKAALLRAEQAETLNAQFRLTIQALKADRHRLLRGAGL